MIITRTPVRFTLFGSSTDYKEWWSNHGGLSINCAINKYSWITLKQLAPFFDFKSKFSYSDIETVKSHREIKHNIIREALLYLNIHDGIDLVHQSDLFSKCGLGSSSTFAVCLMHTLSAWSNEFWTKKELATSTSHLEQVILKEKVGMQDTLSAAYGGLNRFDYYPNGDITVTPIFLNRDFLSYFEKCVMLFFTGVQREAHSIVSNYPSLLDKEKEQFSMMDIAKEGYAALQKGNLEEVGHLLNLTWQEKRKISTNISTETVENAYNICKGRAWGFKLMGAGGGGTILVLADPTQHQHIEQSLGLTRIHFKIDWNGSKILYINHDGLPRT